MAPADGADGKWRDGVGPVAALLCVGDVTVEEEAEGAAEGEAEGAVEDGDDPTPRRRHAAHVQLLKHDGHRQLIRSSADMWLITWWYERRRHASPAPQRERQHHSTSHRSRQ